MRILAYSHDSFGLGHLRRNVTMARALVAAGEQVEVLCLAGSPVPDLFPLPDRCDLVKLPTISKDAQGNYVSRRLPLTFGEVSALRSDLITATVRSFRPDVMLVDHAPSGPGGELLPVLRMLHLDGGRTRVVLGLRDVIDEPEAVREQLAANDSIEHMRRFYDEVLVYGDRAVFDPVAAYDLPDEIARKTHFTGPVVAPEATALRAPRRPRQQQQLLVTTGGGEDGYEVLRSAVAAMRGPMAGRQVRATVVAGPMLAEDCYRSLQLAVERDPRITLQRSSRDMQALRADSDLVVGMGGYNTVYECLASGTRLLAVPRTHPRREQWERCRSLQQLGVLDMVEMRDAADPHRLAADIERGLAMGLAAGTNAWPCRGAGVAANLILSARSRSRGRVVNTRRVRV